LTLRISLQVSHTWSSGQDQAHTIVRQLQLLMPTIQIWLGALTSQPCRSHSRSSYHATAS
jgi:hypothetical protein